MSDFLEELDEQIRKAKEEKDLLEIRRAWNTQRKSYRRT